MLEINRLTFKIKSRTIIGDLSLKTKPGQCLALLGPSGCGKTTLLRLIAGFERPDRGTIKIGGIVASTADRQIPPYVRDIGMVFQDLALWPHMTARQHLAFTIGKQIKGRKDRNRRIDSTLHQVRLSNFDAAFPHQLSGGEKQRLALARALVLEPKILLLDEPLSGLDTKLRADLLEEIRQTIAGSDTTTMYVTHDQKEAAAIADAVALMDNGTIESVVPARQKPVANSDFSQDGSGNDVDQRCENTNIIELRRYLAK